MRHKLRVATGLLLATAALPLAPAFAQDAQPQPDTATQSPTPAPAPAPTEPVQQPAPAAEAPVATTGTPVVNTRASGREPASAEATDEAAETGPTPARPAARQRPARNTARAAAPARPRAVTEPRPAPAEAETPVAAAPAPVPEPALGPAEAPAPVAEAPAPEAAAPAAEAADPLPVAENRQAGTSIWPWLIAAALAAGALLLLLRSRRRRVDEDYVAYEEPVAYREPVAATPDEHVHHTPVAAAPVAPVHHQPVAVAPAEHRHVEPVAAAAPAAAAASAGADRPWIDLMMRPVRAGVGEDAARVEFELGVENNGSAPAHDVRISTWLLPAGSGTEMERMLIDRPAAPARTEASIAPGDGTRIETAVALRREVLVDAILPVVVADARYRLPDGSEGHTSASFAVGVWRGDEPVMFDVENPSGMHEGVEARLHGEPRRD